MKRLIQSLKSQSIGVLALFVALGGTGYAAISIPKNSVGTRQLRNGAVTSKKLANAAVTAEKLAKGSIGPADLNSTSIPGYVALWARIFSTGQVVASSVPVTVTEIGPGPASPLLTLHGELPSNCFALANVEGGAVGYASADSSSRNGSTEIQVSIEQVDAPNSYELDVVEICP
jgi:hypothetical protein